MFFFLVLSSLLLVSEVSGALAHVARGCAVEGLLDAGADPNFSTLVFTPFMHAASKGHTKLMQVRWSVSVYRSVGAAFYRRAPGQLQPCTHRCAASLKPKL